MNSKYLFIFPTIILVTVVIILSSHPLIDPDLGWNLAGGLWIVDNFQIPTVDPLAALKSPWIDYCFLPQILFALIFKAFNFRGLLALQIVIPAILVLSASVFIFDRFLGQSDTIWERLRPVLLIALLIVFVAPIFHLRPQLLSTLIFLFFLHWRASKERNLAILTLILLVWDSTHVYWIFGPVILLTDLLWARLLERQSVSWKPFCLSLFIPILSPYGIRNYLPIIQYSLFHSHVKNLIQEFQPLIFTEGYLFPVTCALFALILYNFWRSGLSTENLVLSTMFFGLSLWQMKFTPLFGVFGISALIGNRTVGKNYLGAKLVAQLYFVVMAGAIVSSLALSEPVGVIQQELLSCGRKVSRLEGPIFTQFNSGGWLELGIYLAHKNSNAKPWIDGRTLVMGERRLTDYFLVSSEKIPLGDYLLDKDIKYLVLNKNSPLTKSDYLEKAETLFESTNYLLLRRSLISVNSS